jgi:hypothetical protein
MNETMLRAQASPAYKAKKSVLTNLLALPVTRLTPRVKSVGDLVFGSGHLVRQTLLRSSRLISGVSVNLYLRKSAFIRG